MMPIPVDVGYIIREQDKENFSDERAVTEFLVYAAVSKLHETLDKTDSRLFGRIQEKMAQANGFFDFDGTEVEWVLEQLEKADLPPNLSMWKWSLIGHLRKSTDANN